MAFTVQVLEDGARNYIIKVTGTATDAAALLVDVSTLSKDPTYNRDCVRVRLDELKYDIAPAVSAQLLWDATTDVPVWTMTEGPGQSVCFKDAGGINNPMVAAGSTGDVMLTTTGAASYNFVAYFTKKYFLP